MMEGFSNLSITDLSTASISQGRPAGGSSSVFKGVVFFLSGQTSVVIEARLRAGGARKASYLSGLVTHCVAGLEHEEAEVAEAEELLDIPVVEGEWVRQSALCGQTLPVKGFKACGGQLFSGVTVRVIGLGRGDVDRIWAMVTWHGGRVVVGEVGVVTHEVTGILCGGESRNWLVVTPDWVVDSVKRGQRMEEKMYNTEMLLVPGSVKVAATRPHVFSTPVCTKPLLMKSKFFQPASPSRLPASPTVVSAILNGSTDTNEAITDSWTALQAFTPLRPHKLSFPLPVMSFNKEINGNILCTAGVEGMLESISEEEKEEAEDVVAEESKSVETCPIKKLKLPDSRRDEKDTNGGIINAHSDLRKGDENNKELIKNHSEILVRKRGKPCLVNVEPKKEIPDKIKRRRSVRLMDKQDSVEAALEESCYGKPMIQEKTTAKHTIPSSGKISSKFSLSDQDKTNSPSATKKQSSGVAGRLAQLKSHKPGKQVVSTPSTGFKHINEDRLDVSRLGRGFSDGGSGLGSVRRGPPGPPVKDNRRRSVRLTAKIT